MPSKKAAKKISVKDLVVSSFGNCKDKHCDCHVHLYRKHCLKCKQLMKGMTVVQGEVCPECAASNEKPA